MNIYKLIGLMSGTSLDGLDIAFIEFIIDKGEINFEIKYAETIKYESEILKIFETSINTNGIDLLKSHNFYGTYLGKKVNEFIKKFKIKDIDFIASHGHTIFHQPEIQLSFQLGNPAYIASETGIKTIGDFRTLDVALGGQGAPLVPIGDKLLFGDYDFCVNLGGFANISFENNNIRLAYDICPVNIVINEFARRFNKDFDENGDLGRKGKINNELLACLNNINYYKKAYPKSLGKEWIEKHFNVCLNSSNISDLDKLRTVYEHIAIQISNSVNSDGEKSILFTGGGTYNKFLIELINNKTKNKIIIPDKIIIDFKEALIFGLLGVLRIENKINTLASVTGASKDSIGGCVYNYS